MFILAGFCYFHRLFPESPTLRKMQAYPLRQQHLLKAELSSLQSEKELAESKLRHVKAQVTALEEENAALKSEARVARGKSLCMCIPFPLPS